MSKVKIEGYNVKSKQKEEMKDVVINKNGNRYFAKGVSAVDGVQAMSAIMGKDNAEKAIETKSATKGEGW